MSTKQSIQEIRARLDLAAQAEQAARLQSERANLEAAARRTERARSWYSRRIDQILAATSDPERALKLYREHIEPLRLAQDANLRRLTGTLFACKLLDRENYTRFLATRPSDAELDAEEES